MLALQARQREVLRRLLRGDSGRLACVMMLAVGGCASRPTLPHADATTPASPSEPAASSTKAATVAVGYTEAMPQPGLIETLPPKSPLIQYPPNSFTAQNLPTVPAGRVPATLVSHFQGPVPRESSGLSETLPAPAPVDESQVVAPPPGPGVFAAPPFQPPNQVPPQPASPQAGNERWLRMPTASAAVENVELSTTSELVSLTARGAGLDTVLAMIAEQHGLNIVTSTDVTEQISVRITNARLEDALDAILATNGYTWARRSNIIIVSKLSGDETSSPAAQGRQVQVFTLNYMAANDADKIVQGLLSPVGQSFITSTVPTDHRRTHEQLVVEDLPEYLYRIEQYLCQADTAPRQVQIEAHVLQVSLKDNFRHGVNFKQLLSMGHTDVSLSTVGLASSGTPASVIRLQAGDLDTLIEALQATGDTKTLASPKVTVLNNQEAHMQVGGKIGYLMSTTTQTSTLQSVNFLDVGVILTVLPTITADGQVLIKVAPQVSTGRINPTTSLPESETTEVKTQVLLADGEAIVIGGLIKETDNDSRSKVPFLGDLWLVGWLFQKREVLRERNEIIITLVPRIVPELPGCRTLDPQDVEQAHTPLLYGDLRSVDRTRFEAKFPCYSERPRNRAQYDAPSQWTPPQCEPFDPALGAGNSGYPIVVDPANVQPPRNNLPLEMPMPNEVRPIRQP